MHARASATAFAFTPAIFAPRTKTHTNHNRRQARVGGELAKLPFSNKIVSAMRKLIFCDVRLKISKKLCGDRSSINFSSECFLAS